MRRLAVFGGSPLEVGHTVIGILGPNCVWSQAPDRSYKPVEYLWLICWVECVTKIPERHLDR